MSSNERFFFFNGVIGYVTKGFHSSSALCTNSMIDERHNDLNDKHTIL
jgi:hypothetical protein